MIGLNPFLIGLLSSIISFLALWAGNYITDFLNKWGLDKKANNLAGIILIIILKTGIQECSSCYRIKKVIHSNKASKRH